MKWRGRRLPLSPTRGEGWGEGGGLGNSLRWFQQRKLKFDPGRGFYWTDGAFCDSLQALQKAPKTFTVQKQARGARRNNPTRCVIWLTGLCCSGKSSLAFELERRLAELGELVRVLDGDAVRHGLCSDLGFSPGDRRENIRRIGEVARLFAESGVICIAALVSPYRTDRRQARRLMSPGRFVEVYVNAPLAVCEQRDRKGMYAQARRGRLRRFTGVSAPYEPPTRPEIELHTDKLSVTECVSKMIGYLRSRKLLKAPMKSKRARR